MQFGAVYPVHARGGLNGVCIFCVYVLWQENNGGVGTGGGVKLLRWSTARNFYIFIYQIEKNYFFFEANDIFDIRYFYFFIVRRLVVFQCAE